MKTSLQLPNCLLEQFIYHAGLVAVLANNQLYVVFLYFKTLLKFYNYKSHPHSNYPSPILSHFRKSSYYIQQEGQESIVNINCDVPFRFQIQESHRPVSSDKAKPEFRTGSIPATFFLIMAISSNNAVRLSLCCSVRHSQQKHDHIKQHGINILQNQRELGLANDVADQLYKTYHIKTGMNNIWHAGTVSRVPCIVYVYSPLGYTSKLKPY